MSTAQTPQTGLEKIKSLTADEPPMLDVQAIAEAATRSVVEALSAEPQAELDIPEAEVAAVTEKPTTVSAPEAAVPLLRVQYGDGAVLLSAQVVSLLRASLKANLQDVTNKVLWAMLED
jgi:hypothetical protein